MKILTVNEMLEAAQDCDLPDEHVLAMEKAATKLAGALATHLGIDCGPAEFERNYGGLCAAFGPSQPGQECPPCIDDKDPGGDWEGGELPVS